MPRRKSVQAGAPYQQIQQQARALLLSLRAEIRGKQAELERLKEEEMALDRLSGSVGAVASPSKPARRGRATGGRVDWSGILQQLPKQFKAADVRGIRAVVGKRSSEIFAAITRWIEGGAVKRKARGLYERA
ncbi:MAG TPA: hypothetical protein VKS22_10560 [Candidatus Binataceae bacterium]|nr:hypothetical protein [Candidatus Binataceae bacterium]